METDVRHTLPKSHILRNKTDIDALLEQGSVLFRYPIKVYWRPQELAFSRMMVSVPKRNFKRAVKRNLLKRRIREAWRLNAALLGEKRIDVLLVYLGREIENYDRIQTTVTGILHLLADDRTAHRSVPADSAR